MAFEAADKCIIIGGAGFIGRHLARFMKEHRPHISCHLYDIAKNASPEIQPLDVRKPFDLEGDWNERTILFNLAAIHKTPGHPDYDYFETNIRGAENVCAFASKHNIRSIVFTSSIAPYGASEKIKSESTLPTPNTPYGISKLVAEKIHGIWQAGHPDNRLAIVRPGIVFGKGEGGNFTRLYKALAKGMFAYAGRKDTVKAAIYVKDLVRIMTEMAENPNEAHQLYNCCYAPAQTIEQIVAAVQRNTGLNRNPPLIPAPALTATASILSVFDKFGLGVHPDRVRKLMNSTNIDGFRLAKAYPLQFGLDQAIADWFTDCEGKGLF